MKLVANIKLLLLIFAVYFCGLMILWFFMPVSETMYCGNDLKCKIETTFAPDVKFTKNIQISANSALELTKAYRRRGSLSNLVSP